MLHSLKARVAPLVLVVLLGMPGRAENDFDFVKRLMDRGYEDLAERFLKDLQQNGDLNEKLASYLGYGALKREQARTAVSSQQKEKRYQEALKFFKIFMEKAGKSHPEYGKAVSEVAAIEVDSIKALLGVIKEEKGEAAIGAIRAKARKRFDKVLKPLKETADAETKKFVKIKKDMLARRGPQRQQLRRKFTAQFSVALSAEQRYIMQAFEKHRAYRPQSDAHKQWIEGALVKYMIHLLEEVYGDLEPEPTGVIMWMNFYKGLSYGALPDVEKAVKDGFDVTLEFTGKDPFIQNMRKHALYQKAKVYRETGKFQESIGAIDDMMMEFRKVLRHPEKGKVVRLALVLRAEALAGLKEYREALEQCQAVVKLGGAIRHNAEKAMVKIYKQARKDGVHVPLSPAAHKSGADGLMAGASRAKARGDEEAAKALLEEAVQEYKSAIRAAGEKDVPLTERMRIEPSAYFQSGLAYFKLGLLYESRLAFEGVLKYWGFLPELALRDPDGKKARDYLSVLKGKEKARVADIIKAVKTQKSMKARVMDIETLVKKAANNMRIAANARQKKSGYSFDRELFKDALRKLIQYDPEKRPNMDFFLAQATFEEAKSARYDAGKAAKRLNRILADGKKRSYADLMALAQENDRLHQRAIESFQEAGALYAKVKSDSQYYSRALFIAGQMSYMVVTLNDILRKQRRNFPAALTDAVAKNEKVIGRINAQIEQYQARIKEHGDKAIAQWDKFKKFAKRKKTLSTQEVERRKRYIADLEYGRPVLYSFMDQYDDVIRSAESYIRSGLGSRKRILSIRWKQFKAGRDKALHLKDISLPEAAAALMAAGKIVNHFTGEDVRKYFITSCNLMGHGWMQFGNVIKDKQNEVNQVLKPKAKSQADLDALNVRYAALEEKAKTYSGQSAFWFGQPLDDMENADPKKKLFIANQHWDLKDYPKAQQYYRKYLDAKKDSIFIVEVEKNLQRFDQVAKLIKVEPFSTQKRIQSLIQVKLKDYIFDKPGIETRDPDDIKEEIRDFDKAVGVVDEIFAEVKKLPDRLGKTQDIPLETKQFLKVVRDEMMHRLVMLQVNDRISQCYMKLAETDEAAGRGAEAMKNWLAATRSFEKLKQYWFSDPDIQSNLGRCYFAAGKLAAAADAPPANAITYLRNAHKTFIEVKDFTTQGDALWFETVISLAYTELLLGRLTNDMKMVNNAAGRGQHILFTFSPAKAEEMWPGLKAFLAEAGKITGKDYLKLADAPKTDEKSRVDYENLITPAEQDLLRQLRNVDMNLLIDAQIPWKKRSEVSGLVEKAIKSQPPKVDKELRRKRYRYKIEGFMLTAEFGEVSWTEMMLHLKKKAVWAYMTPDEEKSRETVRAQKVVRGILGQARLLHILRKVDYNLLTAKKVKWATGNIHHAMSEALARGKIDREVHKKSQREALYKEMSEPGFAAFTEFSDLSTQIQKKLTRADAKEATVNGLLAQARLLYKLQRLVRVDLVKPAYGELGSYISLSNDLKQVAGAVRIPQQSLNSLLERAAKARKKAKQDGKVPAAGAREASEQALFASLGETLEKDLSTAPFGVFAGRTSYFNSGLRKTATLLNLEVGALLKAAQSKGKSAQPKKKK